MAGILKWDLGDASNNVNSNAFSHIYASSGNKTVKVYKGTATGPEAITGIIMDNDNLVGTIDVSSFYQLSSLDVHGNLKLQQLIPPKTSSAASFGLTANDCCIGPVIDISSLTNLSAFQVFNNKQLTTIYNPPSSEVINAYYAFSCGLVGTLDVSGLSLQGNVRLEINPNLQNVLFNSPESITYFTLNNCNLTGTLDLSKLTGLGGSVNISNNPNLTQIKNPSSNTSFAGGSYSVYNCNLTGTLDVSGYKRLGGQFNVTGNPSLNYIISPNSSEAFTLWKAYSNSLKAPLDISGLTGLGGEFDVHSNPNINYIYNPSTNGASAAFSKYYVYQCGLMGTLDLRPLKNLGGDIQLDYNPSLNMVLFPNSTKTISNLTLQGTDISGNLDLSGLTGLGGTVWMYGNHKLTGLKMPASANSIYGGFLAYGNNLTGTLDVSGLNLASSFQVDVNPLLTNIIFPSNITSNLVISMNQCDLTGTIDMSGIKKISNFFSGHSNVNLQNLIIADISNNLTAFNLYNCSLNTSCIDDILGKFDAYHVIYTPNFDLSINLSGYKMAKPSIDGSTHIANLKLWCASTGHVARIDVN